MRKSSVFFQKRTFFIVPQSGTLKTPASLNRRHNPYGLIFEGGKKWNFYTVANAAKIGGEKKYPGKTCLKPSFLPNF